MTKEGRAVGLVEPPPVTVTVRCSKTFQEVQYEPFTVDVTLTRTFLTYSAAKGAIEGIALDIQDEIDKVLEERERSFKDED